MALTNQQTKIIEIIRTAGKATASEVNNIAIAKKDEIGNVHEQLTRLVQNGYINRIGNEYEVSKKADILLKTPDVEVETPSVSFSNEETAAFAQFSKDPDVLNKLAGRLNPSLLGLGKERLAVLLSMVSIPDSYNSKNRVSVLIYGDTATGKTAMIKWASENLWGVYTGNNVSGVGLIGRVNGSQYKPGLLSKANNGTLFIDELDKFDAEERDALLTSMQSGALSIHKDGVDKNLNTQVRIIATCNSTGSFREELISRFDLVIETRELTKDEREALIRQKINDWNREGEVISEEFFKKYMLYAVQQPVRLPENREWLSDILVHETRHGSLLSSDVRGIEKAMRLSLSIARLKLKREVDMDDVKDAINIIKETKNE